MLFFRLLHQFSAHAERKLATQVELNIISLLIIKSFIRSFVLELLTIAVAGDLDFSEDNIVCLTACRIDLYYKIAQQILRIARTRLAKLATALSLACCIADMPIS